MADTRQTGKVDSARFTRHFTKEQKDALMRAVCVDGHSIAQARRMARNGELGMPAFTIGTYAYKYIREHRETFERQDDQALNRAIKDELRHAEVDALNELREVRRKAKTDGKRDVNALARASKALAVIRQARRQADVISRAPAEIKDTRDTNGSNQTPSAGDVLATLLETATPAQRETTRQHEQRDANDATKQHEAQGGKFGSHVRASSGVEPNAADRPTSALV